MERKFELQREKRGDRAIIRLIGPITEDSGLHFLRLYDIPGKCTFNFRDVISINSNGLRAWMLFLRDFANDRDIFLEECPPVIVNQMNMLPSFTQKAKVQSVYVPLFCESCKHVTSLLVEAKDFPAPGESFFEVPCAKCSAPTSLDEAGYFDFADESNLS